MLQLPKHHFLWLILPHIYHIFFIHSSVDGHLDWFHIFTIVDNIAIYIEVHVSFWTRFFFFFSDLFPGVKLLGHMVGLWEGNGNPFQYSCLENPMDRGIYYPWGSQTVGHDWVTKTTIIGLFLVFWKTFILWFHKLAIPIYIPPTMYKDYLFSTSSPIFIFVLSDNSYRDRYKVISHCGFDLHFPDD